MITYPLAIPYSNTVTSNKKEAVTNNPATNTTLHGFNAINWDGIAKLFKDPRATPAFYKLALGLLTDLLSHQRGMEQLAIQRQVASTRDITPMINLINNMDNRILKMYELYSTMPDKNSPQAISLATYITQLEKARDDMYAKIAKYYGIDVPSVSFNPSLQGVPTPQTKSSSKGSILSSLSSAIPSGTFAPEEYVFVRPLKTVFGGGLKEVFEPELTFFGLK